MGEGGGHINEVWPSGDGRSLVRFSWWRPGAMGAFRTFLKFNPTEWIRSCYIRQKCL